MDKEERRAAEAERRTEALSDYLDEVSEEDFDPSTVEDWFSALGAQDGEEDAFDAAAAEAAFRARHGVLLTPEAPGTKARRVIRLRRMLPRLAGVAAAAVLVVALAGHGLGLDLFRHAVSWTRGEFTFTTGEGEMPEEVSYSDGQAALDAYGVTEPMLPTWNPAWEGEDTPSLEVTVTEEADGTILFTEDHRTQSGAGYTFLVRQRKDARTAEADIQGKDDPDTLVYDFDGRSYYIVPLDGGGYRITWASGRYSGEIWGDMDLEQAKHFVRSITKPDQWVYEVPDMSEPPKYATIQEAMEAAGIDAAYAPTWLPEGFVPVQSDIYVSEENGWCAAHLFATNVEEERNLSLSFDLRTDPGGVGSTVYPKDDTPIVTIERGGVTFYIISNGAWRSLAWMDGGISGSVGGNLTEEECRQILDSIPRYAS